LNLNSFTLSENDPNYSAYAEGIYSLHDGQPIHYYQHKAEKLNQDDKMTMYVDFYHLSNFPH